MSLTSFVPIINRVCFHAYTLGLLLAVLTMGLTPIHQTLRSRADITRTYGDGRFEVVGDLEGLSVGDSVSVLRFNPGWRHEIGQATVLAREPDKVVFGHDPSRFIWPLGVTGQLTRVEGRDVEVDVGKSQGVDRGSRLHVFEERKMVGGVSVLGASADAAQGTSASTHLRRGQSVTPYTVQNQISWNRSALLPAIEWGLISLTLGLWLWSVFSSRPGTWVRQSAAAMKRRARALPFWLRAVFQLVLGVLVVRVVSQIALWTITYGATRLLPFVRKAGIPISYSPPPFPEAPLPYIYGAVGLLYVIVLFRKRLSPMVLGWQALKFRPPSFSWLPVPRYLVLWFLHLFIFYAFASTLSELLVGNLSVVADYGWRGVPLSFQKNSDVLASLGYMLTHAPEPITLAGGFMVARYFLWSATITACIIGYGHTVVSVLWKEPLRNVDFTFTGWIVNAICYGPLLGSVLYRIAPGVPEVDPAISGGPLAVLQLSVELLLNLLYTLSIWNLGTMFGVMVDKGVRKAGFYSVVRHPSYTLEGLMFVMLFLPGLTSPEHWLVALVFPIKYWIRSERDDAFMSGANPEYGPYQESVPYKLIPGVY